MTISQRLMKPGRFSISLADNHPDSMAAAAALFDHIVITPTPIDCDATSDAGMLSSSIYTGVITSKPSLRTFEGADLAYWLGTDNGLGDLLDTAVALTAGTLTQWITALCPASLTLGTITDTSTTTNSFQWVTRREAIDAVCRTLSAEWRVNPNGTLDAGPKATLFVTPTDNTGVVITRKDEGADGGLIGLEGNLMVPGSDVEQYTTKVFALGSQVVAGGAVEVATATGATTYKDLRNGTVVMEKIVNSPTDPTTPLAGVAASVLGQFNQVRREISLASHTYTVTRFIHPGDEAWVFDLRAELTDPANQIEYRGELITPIKLRVMALTWPIEEGCGVYLRKSAATPTYLDLSPYIAWETGDVQWEVGAASRTIVGNAATGTAYLGDHAGVANRLA